MLRTRICEMLGIEHPILSAPMARTATAELAAAVSEAGALGMIGGTNPAGPEWLRAQIRAVRERTRRPFGVGFISSFPSIGALVQVAPPVAASAERPEGWIIGLAVVSIALVAINMFGGFAVTQRMLQMFRK